ncbi:MAG: 4Fe-4S dicluster domain-containing protein [Candidatus Bathyarchaeota archaeon]|nr:MAG: 4Fe-4S dicluster domain-containing protein [Candidatus Bathyarchaeota archaeon]
MSNPIWIVRDYLKCSGCRRCEIACSMHHEDWMWPEASRVRVFMPFPGVEVPHLCAQCDDYPCVDSCSFDALSVDEDTSAVIVDREKCTSCALCIKACPGQVPFLHPGDNKATVCNLCEGDPECVKVCQEARYNALSVVEEKPNVNRKLFAMHPIEVAKDLAVNLFGEKGEEVI